MTVAALAATYSCTDFKDDDAPAGLTLSENELSFSSNADTRSLTLRSGSKWEVASRPDWVKVQSITSGTSSYEWNVVFSATANNSFNREGTIVIKANTDSKSLPVKQEGKNGAYVAVQSVSLSSTELSLTEGDTATLTYEISPLSASIKNVSWSSSTPSVATVESGRVQALAEGTTLITVTTEDGNKSASCVVTVKPKVINVTGVTLDKTSLTMIEGDTQTLTATVSPSNATDKSVTWSSNNTSVATVSSSGVVTARVAGSAIITVKTTDGSKTATCAVTVKSKNVSGSGNEGTGESELF